jgi:hypothetical protein
MSGLPIMKDGRFESPTVLAWCRRQPCRFCGASGPSDPHHFPPKGMGGARINDTQVIPLCRWCHDRAQRYEAPLTREWQLLALCSTIFGFVNLASADEWDAFCSDRKRWAASRIFEVPA